MLPLVCSDAVAILFTFDLSRKSTLNSLREWYRQARGLNKVDCMFFNKQAVLLTQFFVVRALCHCWWARNTMNLLICQTPIRKKLLDKQENTQK